MRPYVLNGWEAVAASIAGDRGLGVAFCLFALAIGTLAFSFVTEAEAGPRAALLPFRMAMRDP